MKKLFLILAIILLFGCPDPGNNDTPTLPDPEIPDDPPVIDPPIETPSGPVLFSLYDGEKMMYYDGIDISIAYYGNIENAGNKMFSIENVLYHFNDNGIPTLTEWLPIIPDAIIAIPKSVPSPAPAGMSRAIVYQDEVWTLEDIEPADALAAGAQFKHYTRIYQYETEIGNWYLNDWEVKKVISPKCGGVIAIDTLKNYHNLDGSEIVFFAQNKKLMIHDVNINTKTGKFKTDTGNYSVSWTFNFFISAKWALADGDWYSHNGYTFDDVNLLQENNTVMWDWNQYPYPVQDIYGEAPVLISVGEREENSIEVLYWIECNTGTLIRYIPGIDQLNILPKLYNGTGYRTSGIAKSNILEPEIVGNELYYHDSGNIMIYNFITSAISVFSGDMELNVW